MIEKIAVVDLNRLNTDYELCNLEQINKAFHRGVLRHSISARLIGACSGPGAGQIYIVLPGVLIHPG
jgi:hypothetical protein